MSALSEYLQSRVQKAIFHGEPLTIPTNISIGLTSAPAQDNQDGATIPEIPETVTRSGVKEGVSGEYEYPTGYSRVSIGRPSVNGSGKWEYVAGGQIKNINQIVFNTCLEDWGSVSGIVVLDSSAHGSGNLLFHGTLEKPRVVLQGDAPKYDANVLQIYLD
jgi:hypothetical protein